ncbi:hypothetical protein MFS40622_1113 [Methanocaldococcus sp. FS406-22]|uniref:hypothetical protein n=1 Tax=Methanocaldococcus sp. (strain FS406-22) TaxID=644281 RepID=UPI0001BF350F|nr:hypothetical protein [Methanocaldococcus sp. FS406-22]ADC69793.1 hypothetical protein MFS40622_1113 [Methanocaldococcus sp. FS406-22]
MRFLVVKTRHAVRRINVDRIINIQSFDNKVKILYDIGGECHSVELEVKGSAEHVADYIMNMILSDIKLIDLRDMERLEFKKASELAGKIPA